MYVELMVMASIGMLFLVTFIVGVSYGESRAEEKHKGGDKNGHPY